MQSPTSEEMMKLQMYDTIVDVRYSCIYTIQLQMYKTQKKNGVSYKCTMQLRMYKKRMLNNKLQKGAVKLKHVPTVEHVANVLTKPLACVKIEYFRDKLGVVRKDLSRKRE